VDTRDDARDAAVIRLMLDTGVTVSEIQGLLRSNLDLEVAQIELTGPAPITPPAPSASPKRRSKPSVATWRCATTRHPS
jgi:integrase